MQPFQLYYSTSASVPPPFAHEISLEVRPAAREVQLKFAIQYSDREELTKEEIEEEGFTIEDDFEWEGTLPFAWKEVFEQTLKHTKPYNEKSQEKTDLFKIILDEGAFQPKDFELTKSILEQIQQAIFEIEQYEAPLHYTILRKQSSVQQQVELHASFEKLEFRIEKKEKSVQLSWDSLGDAIGKIYTGELYYEKASNKYPSKNGLYINLGDEWWFEVGKSYIGSPSNLLRFFDL